MVLFGIDSLRNNKFVTGPRFAVEIDGSIVASFSECSGISGTVRSDKWEEGGANDTTYKFPGRAEFDNLTLKHGITDGTDLYKWFLDTAQGKKRRKTITVKMVPPDAQGEIQSWHLSNAFPVRWIGPASQVGASAMAIETLEFAHDGLVLT